MLKRYYTSKIQNYLASGKVLVIYGPRRVGKTTLVNDFLSKYKGRVYTSTGENIQLRNILESSDFSKIIPFFKNYDLIVIDEAQKIDNVGQGLKIVVDQIPEIQVIATGSSSFDLSNKIGEPLVGRQKILKLYPLSAIELDDNFGSSYIQENLENLMIFGSYPEIITGSSFDEKIEFLHQIRDSYLYKDLLELERIRNSKKILDLLRLIAFQIGQEVSLQEIGKNLGLSKNTVAKYLDLLEKSFVLINIRGFSRNLRKEITKTSRYYYYDNGIRNAVIGNFNFLNSRNDQGQLWENFLFIERLKKQHYHKIYSNNFFWRTWDQKEIDMVEEREGKLYGYEFKYRKKRVKPPKDWIEAYENTSFEVISQDNYLNFIL
jgi:predicted AAA+ superfamily ATPase